MAANEKDAHTRSLGLSHRQLCALLVNQGKERSGTSGGLTAHIASRKRSSRRTLALGIRFHTPRLVSCWPILNSHTLRRKHPHNTRSIRTRGKRGEESDSSHTNVAAISANGDKNRKKQKAKSAKTHS